MQKVDAPVGLAKEMADRQLAGLESPPDKNDGSVQDGDDAKTERRRPPPHISAITELLESPNLILSNGGPQSAGPAPYRHSTPTPPKRRRPSPCMALPTSNLRWSSSFARGRRSWRPCPADQACNPWPSSGSGRRWWCQSPDRCWAWSWRSRPKFRCRLGKGKAGGKRRRGSAQLRVAPTYLARQAASKHSNDRTWPLQ